MYTVQDQEEQNFHMREENREDDLVSGQYSWVAPDGIRYTVVYTAGQDGYRAEVKKEESVPVKPLHKEMVRLARTTHFCRLRIRRQILKKLE